jgi:hypothetical protein
MKIFTLILLICVISTHLRAQEKQVAARIDSIVREMRSNAWRYQIVEDINTNNSFSRYYYLDGELQMKRIHLKDSIEKNVEWFFMNGELAFAETTWTETRSGMVTFHETYYLSNHALIAWIDSGNCPIDPTSPGFADLGKKLADYGTKIRMNACR